jgi:hypothetical protein
VYFDSRPPRQRLVAFKISDEELLTLRKAARRSGARSVSAFLRRLIAVAVSAQ